MLFIFLVLSALGRKDASFVGLFKQLLIALSERIFVPNALWLLSVGRLALKFSTKGAKSLVS